MSENVEKIEEIKGDRGVLVLKQTLGSDILQSFFQFFKLAEIHDPGNEVFKKATADLLQALQVWINIPEFQRLQFLLSGDQIFINDVRIRPKPRFIEKIQYVLKFLRKRRLVGFVFDKTPTTEHLEQILWMMAKADSKTAGDLPDLLIEKGITGFRFESLLWKKDAKSSEFKSFATDLYDQLFTFSKTVFDKFDDATKIEPPALGPMFDSLQMMDEADLISLFCLRTAKRAEHLLAQIATNSAFMLYAWGRSLGLPPGVFSELAGAGLAHPLVLVNSFGGFKKDILSFDRSNLAMSNLHRIKRVWPLTELQTLAVLEWPIPFGSNGVYQIAGQKCYQHFFSRMLRVVATFQQLLAVDANATPENTVGKLLTAEMGCDQTLVRLFLHWLGIFPVGSFVRLKNGEIGQICSLENNLFNQRRPTITIFKDKDGNLLDTPQVVDLNDFEDSDLQGIKEGIAPATAAVPPEKVALLSSLSLSVSN